MNEALYKRSLVHEIKQLPGGWARRIEDRFAVGVLDMIIKLPGVPVFFAEGKHVVSGNLFRPTDRQYQEGLELQAAYIWCVLIGWKQGIMYISPWVKQADIRELTPYPNHLRGLMEYTNDRHRFELMKENDE